MRNGYQLSTTSQKRKTHNYKEVAMENFNFQCKTELVFGRGRVKELGSLLGDSYENILIHYGKDSIKKSGLYDQVVGILKEEKKKVFELGGVEPNPKLSLVEEGIEIVKKEKIDLILAVGGGSVIDSAKAIGLGGKYDGEVWDFFIGEKEVEDTVPVGVILTIPATGSEASTGTVITKEEGLYKRAVNHHILRPIFAIMDPELTLTLPDKQTFAGVMDIFSHIFERYFTRTKDVNLIDYMSEGAMRSIVENAYKLKEDRDNYAARAEIMLAGTLAHNGLLGIGRVDDWASHNIAHEMSALYEETHGVTLAIIFPAWMKYVYREDLDRFVQFAENVFNVDGKYKSKEEIALEGIKAFEDFLGAIGLPRTFTEGNLPVDDFELMAEKATEGGSMGSFMSLDKEDLIKIYELAK